MFFKHILSIIFLNEPELIFSQLNGFTYFHQIQIIYLLFIICLYTVKCFLVLLCIANHSIKSLTIQLNINHMFTHSQIIEQFYFKQFS